MRIKDLNHKINRKAMIINHIADMYKSLDEIRESEDWNTYACDCRFENAWAAIAEQKDLYEELVATPVGGETRERILVWC